MEVETTDTRTEKQRQSRIHSRYRKKKETPQTLSSQIKDSDINLHLFISQKNETTIPTDTLGHISQEIKNNTIKWN